MIKKLKKDERSEAEEMLDLQLKSYEVEAKLLEVKDFPPLRESVEDIMSSEESFHGIYKGSVLAAMYSYCIKGDEAQLCRLVVHPSFFRLGLASMLIMHFLKEAQSVKKVFVTTGKKNSPAVSLYEKFGFTITEEFTIEGGLSILRLEREQDEIFN